MNASTQPTPNTAAASIGRVVFIGAGPGPADLMTLRGVERLRSANVVLCDALVDPQLKNHAPQAQWIDVGKRGFSDRACDVENGQEGINRLIVEHALQGRCVVRLKGGDPSVFGRLEEELLVVLDAGIACEVVPGITTALLAAATTLRPLTRRGTGRSVSLATAMTRTGDLHATHSADTEIYYMASRQLATLGERLQAAGWPAHTQVLVVSRAGWSDQLTSEHPLSLLAEAAHAHGGRPTAVIIGAGARPLQTLSTTPLTPLPLGDRPTRPPLPLREGQGEGKGVIS